MRIRVFVSSVSHGLEVARGQIISDLRKAAYEVAAMEGFTERVQGLIAGYIGTLGPPADEDKNDDDAEP